MNETSLFEDCQFLIHKGRQSWDLYFSRWEQFAKYEEDIPEIQLFEENTKARRRKLKLPTHHKKLKTTPSIISKKKQRNKRTLIKKKQIPEKSKHEIIERSDVTHEDSISENMENIQLGTILKNVLTELLKANKNEFQMFSVLSQTFSSTEEVANSFQLNRHQKALPWNNTSPSLSLPDRNILERSVCPSRSYYMENLKKQNLFQFSVQPGSWDRERVQTQVFNETFPTFQKNLYEQQLSFAFSGSQRQITQMNLEMRNKSPALLPDSRVEDGKLNSLKWDWNLEPPNSVCRKINKEYFIKRTSLKMNIAQDGKRFRNLCLRKRTNSVTLSMENSNFITPERKPPERKCFSENVSQRKRRRPSKLFFGDDEEEDSDSDDQTEKRGPLIYSTNKRPKIEIIPEVPESDSDDCESIFDRVKKS